MRANTFILSVVVFLILSHASLQAQDARKVLEFGAADCESEMAFLDRFANHLYDEQSSRGYVLIYGGRKDTKRDEVQVRGARIQRYLVENRGIGPDRIEVGDGGYRERFSVELWLIPQDKESPVARPTLKPRDVRFKRGRMERYREPGCFPGRYVVVKARPA